MPKRMLDDSILSSPSLARCSPRAQDAFHRFILLMDDFGCAEANPRVLLGKGWPLRDDVSERDVWAWLEEYVGAGMACLWTEKERRWVHLLGWFGPHGQRRRVEYDPATVAGQKGSKRKTPVPPADLVAAVAAGARRDHDGKPPGVDREDGDEIPGDSTPVRETRGPRQVPGASPAVSRLVPAPAVPVPDAVPDAVAEEKLAPSPSDSTPHSPGPEEETGPAKSDAAGANAAEPGGSAPAARDGGSEPGGVIAGDTSPAGPARRPPDLSPVVLVLPCTGAGPKEYAVTEAQVGKWQRAFPGVDVLGEMRKALAWLEANPARVKTHRGAPAFAVRWLSTAQDRGRPGGAAPARVVTAAAPPRTAYQGGRREL